ncbi:MAG: DUF2723 domain-containing protein [Polyangiales bacterium]
MASASSFGGLYEEGAFVAAARSLGVPHPPGTPITCLAAALAALFPIGPLAFRVAVSCAVFAALILALFARALFFSLRGLGLGAVDARGPAALALAATWFVAQAPMFLAVATRPNVHAVQFAIGLWMIDCLVRFELSQPNDDRRPLYVGAFVQGLSFANHHVFALLLLAVAAPTLGRVFARRGFLGLMAMTVAPIIGFSAWVYVPIRGGREPFINLGSPDKLTRIFWVLNADPWRGPSDVAEPRTWALLARGMSGSLAVVVVLLALAALGLALAARTSNARRFALLWSIALLVPMASIAWILEPTVHADAWGALLPCALGLVALATFGVALGLRELRRLDLGMHRVGYTLAGLAALALVLRASPPSQAPMWIDELARRHLPTRAVVITPTMESMFRWLGAEAEENLRQDVTLLPLAALDYPHSVESLSDESPELAPVLGEYMRGHHLGAASLLALARKRPLRIELDHTVSPALYRTLVPAGWYESLDAPYEDDGEEWSDLAHKLAPELHEPGLSALWARRQLYEAIASASREQRELARTHVALGLRSAAKDPRLLALRNLLGQPMRMDGASLLKLVAERD